jgi:hypothetical protein
LPKRALARGPLDEPLHRHLGDSILHGETRGVRDGQQIGQGAKILWRRFAQRDQPRRQYGQFRSPVRHRETRNFSAHKSDRPSPTPRPEEQN